MPPASMTADRLVSKTNFPKGPLNWKFSPGFALTNRSLNGLPFNRVVMVICSFSVGLEEMVNNREGPRGSCTPSIHTEQY